MDAGRKLEITITPAGVERLDDIQPLWEALHRHHLAVAPSLLALGAPRSPEGSWRIRRAHYLALFEEPSTFALIAEVESDPVGYAVVHIRGPEESWQTGRVAELETLAVLPERRGRGIGSALLGMVFRKLREMSIGHWTVGVIAENRDAHRFYAQLEVLPFMTSFIGRVPPP